MQAIIDTLVKFGKWLLGLVKALLTVVWDMFVDAICWIADKVLSFVVQLLEAIDVSGIGNANPWATLPAEVINMLGLMGFGYAIGIVAAAIVIRLGLQLIPFVRLGS